MLPCCADQSIPLSTIQNSLAILILQSRSIHTLLAFHLPPVIKHTVCRLTFSGNTKADFRSAGLCPNDLETSPSKISYIYKNSFIQHLREQLQMNKDQLSEVEQSKETIHMILSLMAPFSNKSRYLINVY